MKEHRLMPWEMKGGKHPPKAPPPPVGRSTPPPCPGTNRAPAQALLDSILDLTKSPSYSTGVVDGASTLTREMVIEGMAKLEDQRLQPHTHIRHPLSRYCDTCGMQVVPDDVSLPM